MELRPGYKQTEAGIRPEDWTVKTLGKFIALRRGHDLTETARCEGEIPVMGSAGHNGFHDIAVVRGPGLVLGRSGASFGQAHYCPTDFWPHNTALYVTDFLGNEPLFAFYFLKSIDFTRHNSGGAQQSLNRNFIGPIPVSIPDRGEQNTIVQALSDADALIESLEQLLVKKRQIKQGAMQELLTGRKRLPGFTGKWKKRRLGELAVLSKAGINPASTPDAVFTHFSLPAFDAGAEPIIEKGRFIGSNKFVVLPEAVLLSKLNPRIPRIWAPANIPDNAVCSTEFLVLLPREDTNRAYLTVLCISPAIAVQMELHATGTTGSHQRINPTQALGIEIETTHDHNEQTAIAGVVFDMDAEIVALDTKLAKARQLKQGMMQELLTGRIRLVRPSAQILSFPAKETASATSTSHNTHFNEAVVISMLSASFGSETFPLGRFRRTKFAYLLHRHVEREAAGFMKKAAGPYNPSTRYGGAEKIALQNRYVRIVQAEKGEGFVAGEKIAQAEGYFEKWYGTEAITWLEQFRYQKKDALELLTTVDMACEDLSRKGRAATPTAVKQIIHDSHEWKAKLNRSVFSDDNIAKTIQTCGQLFPIEEE